MIRAYLDQLAVWPGEEVVVHFLGAVTGTTEILELIHSDPHLVGPGVIMPPCAWGATTLASEEAPLKQGSYLSAGQGLRAGSDFTLSLWVLPTDLSQTITVASWDGVDGRWLVRLSRFGIEVVSREGAWTLESPVHERMWHFVGISAAADGQTTLFMAPWGRSGGPYTRVISDVHASPASSQLLLGSDNGERGDFDGRIAGVRVHFASLDIIDLMNVMNGFGLAADQEWHFGDRADPDNVPAVGGGEPLELVNAPAWSADQPLPLDNAGHPLCTSGSIHLHRDDVEDCGWDVGARIRVPDQVASGLYVVRVTIDEESQDLPFLVKGSAEVTLLVPTLTWQAYSNLERGPDWPGLSHYALHSDGSPTIITTSLKPSQTFAPSARLEVAETDGFLNGDNVTHLLMADLYAWYWVRSIYPDRVAVIDDRELHFSSDALARTKVLVLSAHPEYWTEAMLDALQAFIDRGGNVIYLGGNGLYWVTSLHPSKPHLMEIRRWGGSQTCSVEPGDVQHQYEPRLGGLWADSGRPPNSLVGVGFSGFGAGPTLEFERTTASYDPEWSWLFEGLENAKFGSRGINTGTCNEFDGYDEALPGPGLSTVLATSAAIRPDHFGTYEARGLRAPSPKVCADLVGTATPAGGIVLAISSISAGGCLVSKMDDGMRRLADNALHRMVDGH